MAATDTVKDLVEGRLRLPAFREAAERDDGLQALLGEDVHLPPYTRHGTLLDYVLAQDPASAASVLNVTDAMDKFLTLKGIDHRTDEGARADYRFLLSVLPSWLSPPDRYLDRLKAAIADAPDKAARTRAAKSRIAADFRSVGKPPRWVQSPNWPFAGDRPLVFVGQLDLGDLLHDTAQVFVFLDEESGEATTLIQRA